MTNKLYSVLIALIAVPTLAFALMIYLSTFRRLRQYDFERLHAFSLLEAAVKSASKAFFILDHNLKLVSLCGATHKITGVYPRTDDSLEFITRRLNESSRANLANAISSALKGYKVKKLDLLMEEGNGHSLRLSLDITPICLNGGEGCDSLFVTVEEATERHNNDARKDLIYTLSSILISESDLNEKLANACRVIAGMPSHITAGILLDKGGALLRVASYTAPAANGLQINAEDSDGLALEAVKAGHSKLDYISSAPENPDVNTEAGEVGSLAIASVPLISSGKILGVLQTFMDPTHDAVKLSLPTLEISARMLADFVSGERNRAQLERLSKVIEYSCEGVILIDSQESIIYSNKAFASLLDIYNIDPSPSSPGGLFSEWESNGIMKRLHGDGHYSGEMHMTGRNGSRATLLVSFFAMPENGEDAGIFAGLMMDITITNGSMAERISIDA